MTERTIPRQESLTIEFKSDQKKLSDGDLLLAIVCLANGSGGAFYLGVENDGTITGLHASRPDPKGLAAFIANRTLPPVETRVDLLHEEGHRVVRVEVPRSKSVVATREGQIQRRQLKHDGTPECVPYFPHEFIGRQADLGELDFSARPALGATLADLDSSERSRLREIHRRFGGDSSLTDLTDDELDGALGFVRDDGNGRVPTVTGLLLLGHERALRRCLPTHEVLFQVLQGSEVQLNESQRGPLLRVVEALEDHLRVRNLETETTVGLFRVRIPTVDERTFREAVLNALTHRDYTRLGAVHVQWKDDTIDIGNPGGFVEGVTLDNLLVTMPRPRNPRLADALKRLGLVERSGRGVDLIYSGLLRYGRAAPDYTLSTSVSVVVSLSHGPADIVFVRMILDEEKRRASPLPFDALVTLSLLRRERRCGLAQIAQAIQRSESAARAVVERLVEAGLVQGRGEGRARVFILSERVYQATDTRSAYLNQRGLDPEEQERAVLALLKERPLIQRAEVAARCGITDDQATRLLRRMVEEGSLERTGERKGTRYRRRGS